MDVKVGELDEFARLRGQSDVQSRVQLAAFDNDEKIRSSFKVKVGPENYCFMVWQDSEEEVVLEVQGLLQSCILPPVRGKSAVR
jgi:hypothetical protein